MNKKEVMAMPDIDLNQESLRLVGNKIPIGFFAKHGWDPTHDIAAAWQLARTILAEGDERQIEIVIRKNKSAVEIWDGPFGESRLIVEEIVEDQLPRAIARASIVAMTEEDK